jgi:hypothetical protein
MSSVSTCVDTITTVCSPSFRLNLSLPLPPPSSPPRRNAILDGVADGHAGVDKEVVQHLVDERLKSHISIPGLDMLERTVLSELTPKFAKANARNPPAT